MTVSVWYPLGWRHLGRGRLGDLLTADLRLALAGSTYTPADTHEWLSDIPQISGPGYVTGGQPVTGRGYDYDTVTGRCVLTCDPVQYTGAGFTARHGVLYLATGTPATSPLIARTTFDADVAPAGVTFAVPFPDGLLTIGPPA